MKNRMLLWSSMGFLLTGCASSGWNVNVVQPLSETDAKQYNEVGPLYCTVDQVTPGQTADQVHEFCRNNLKQQAAAKHADTVVIESQTPIPCAQSTDTNGCIRVTARAYSHIPEAPPPPDSTANSPSGFPSTNSGSSFPGTTPGSNFPNAGSNFPNRGSSYPNQGATYPNAGTTYPNGAGTTYPNNTGTTYPNNAGTTYPNNTGTTYPNNSGTTYPSR